MTALCTDKPHFDCGKFHNHCTQCPDFGQCIYDYRNDHCRRCGDHYFAGLSGFSCPCFGKDNESRGFYGGYNDDDDDDYVYRVVDERIDLNDYLARANTPGDLTSWSGQLDGFTFLQGKHMKQ